MSPEGKRHASSSFATGDGTGTSQSSKPPSAKSSKRLTSSEKPAPRQRGRLCKGNEKVVAGVCSGIAHYLEIDVVVARVTCIVLLVCTCGVVTIPYVALALLLPRPESQDKPLDIHPVSVVSDRYEEVVNVAKPARVKTPERYGIHADAGHMPPVPPKGETSQSHLSNVYVAYQTPTNLHEDETKHQRLLVVLILAVAMLALFSGVANYLCARYDSLEVVDFWPMVFIVMGTILVVCFYDRISLVARVCGLVFSIELCFVLLPFTLGIVPPHAFRRLDLFPLVFVFCAALCLVLGFVRKQPIFLVAVVGLLGVAELCLFAEVGLFARFDVLASYSRHNIISPLFRS